MRIGVTSTVLGCVAIAAVVTIGLSHAGNDGVTGPLVTGIGLLLDPAPVATTPEMKPVGLFSLYESNLRFLLSGLSVATAVLSGVLAVIASRREANSLWYSIGVFASASALAEFTHFGAIVFLVACGWLVMRSRRWKMAQA